jgi:hypothetical protein
VSQQQPTPETLIRGMQIIAAALPLGVIVFALVAVLALGALAQPPSGSIVSLVGVVFAVGAFAAHLVLPNLIAQRAATGPQHLPNELKPYGAYQTRMIMKLALLEGAAFFNVICTVIEHNWWSLGIAGLLVGWMLTNFPTRSRVERWIAEQGMAKSE